MNTRLYAALAATLLHALAGAASLSGAGSTFAEPLYKKWGELYQKQTSGTFAYEGVGSSEGVVRIMAKRVDFGASDEPLKRTELEDKSLRQFPIALGAIVPVVNLPGVPAGELKLNALVLAKIYTGKIKRWRDSDIIDLNDTVAAKIPDLPIKPLFRSDGSGSTFVFSYYLAAFSPEWAKGPGASHDIKGGAGTGVKGSSGMVEAIKQTPGTIGYLDYGHASHDKLNISQLPNRVGIFVKVSGDSIQAAAKADAERLLYIADPDFYLVLANNDTYSGWPMATATFLLLPKAGKDAQKVLDFLYWAFKSGDAASRELGYVPLTETMKVAVRKAWSRQYDYRAGL